MSDVSSRQQHAARLDKVQVSTIANQDVDRVVWEYSAKVKLRMNQVPCLLSLLIDRGPTL